MAGFLDDFLPGVIADALSVIDDTPTFIRREVSEFDETTDSESKVSTKDFPCVSSPPVNYSNKEIDGDAILRGDFELIISSQGLPIEPLPKDKVVRKPKGKPIQVFEIQAVDPIYGGGIASAYTLQCRR